MIISYNYCILCAVARGLLSSSLKDRLTDLNITTLTVSNHSVAVLSTPWCLPLSSQLSYVVVVVIHRSQLQRATSDTVDCCDMVHGPPFFLQTLTTDAAPHAKERPACLATTYSTTHSHSLSCSSGRGASQRAFTMNGTHAHHTHTHHTRTHHIHTHTHTHTLVRTSRPVHIFPCKIAAAYSMCAHMHIYSHIRYVSQ